MLSYYVSIPVAHLSQKKRTEVMTVKDWYLASQLIVTMVLSLTDIPGRKP